MVGLKYCIQVRARSRAGYKNVVTQAMSFLKHKKALTAQFFQVHHAFQRQRMGLGYGKQQSLAQELTTHDVRISQGQAADHNVKVAYLQTLYQVGRDILNQLQIEIGRASQELSDAPR